MTPYVFHDRARQRGATLLVGMIILLLMTVMTITVMKLSKSNAQIVGNMQDRAQAYVAAQSTVEAVISRVDFTATPENAVPSPCGGIANTACVDVNGDGSNDVSVAVTPTCVSTQIIPLSAPDLDFEDPDDQGCLIGTAQNFGTVGATSNDSLCARMLWDIQGTATDLSSNAQVTVHQGTTVRVASTTECPAPAAAAGP